MSKLRVDQISTTDDKNTVNVEDINKASAIDLSHFSNLSLGDWVGQYRSLKSFGAKADGSTDDTAAIQAAFDWAASQPRGAVLWCNPGSYNLTKKIVWEGASSQIYLLGAGSGASVIQWTTKAVSAGLEGGSSTPVAQFFAEGLTLVANIVTTAPAIKVTCNSGSPKSIILKEINAFGSAVGGTASAGYWGDGLAVLVNPVYPVIENCYFFGIGGATSVAKSNLINSGFRIDAKQGVFFANFRNCFANNVNNGIWLRSSGTPGIEGAIISECNMNSTNIGVNAQALAADTGNSSYYPPQLFIDKSQFEYIQRGVSANHLAMLSITNSLFYADATADSAINHITITDVNHSVVSDNFMESRPIHTSINGVSVVGSSSYVDVHNNYIKVPAGAYGVVFAGTSSYCKQKDNIVLGGSEYANTSSNSATNTAIAYDLNGESSYSVGKYIKKSGSKTAALGTGGSFSISFGAPFPNSIVSIVAVNGDSGSSQVPVIITSRTASGFTGFFVNGSSGVNARVDYEATGM
ncbi:glycosyl hydrolase family 28-related protein [Pantoea sp. MBD-2R]|uniref:glycosyl hydrolase family 28-related protein n=1 Tax=Pantoea sp. MBD-2R TaxID=3141540 RepID=UPI003183F775